MNDYLREPRSHCPISYGLDIVGDRWTLLVLRDLIMVGKRHFRDLLAAPEAIASNILAARLKALEAQGLISRRPDPDSGRQYIYEPTTKGLDMLPVMLELVRWSARYDPETAAPRPFVRRLDSDRDAVVAEMRSRHRATSAAKTRR